MNQVTYVSSVKNKYKKAKLNNVIQSLNCFVSCTTPDVTVQDYGYICYCGKIYEGQIIQGNKKPKKAGYPVIVSNTWLGIIDNNGNLEIQNTCSSNTSFVTTTQWQCITLSLEPNATGSSYYCHDTPTCSRTVTCTECCDDQGKYISEVTTTITCTQYHEKCYFANAFPGIKCIEILACDNAFSNKIVCFTCAYFPNMLPIYRHCPSVRCCDFFTCYIWCPDVNQLWYCVCYDGRVVWHVDDSICCLILRACYNGCIGPYDTSWCNGRLCLTRVASQGDCICVWFKCYFCHSSHEDISWYCNIPLDYQSCYCASSTGNVSLSVDPVYCCRFEVCRCIRPIEDEVCFCTRYY